MPIAIAGTKSSASTYSLPDIQSNVSAAEISLISQDGLLVLPLTA
jgi:hypothetical protein